MMKKLFAILALFSTVVLVWCSNKTTIEEQQNQPEVINNAEEINVENQDVKETEITEATENDINELQKQLLEQLDKEINQDENEKTN